MHITGLFYMGGMYASQENRNVPFASLTICANSRKKLFKENNFEKDDTAWSQSGCLILRENRRVSFSSTPGANIGSERYFPTWKTWQLK